MSILIFVYLRTLVLDFEKLSYLIAKESTTFPTLASQVLAFLMDLSKPSLAALRVKLSRIFCHDGSPGLAIEQFTTPFFNAFPISSEFNARQLCARIFSCFLFEKFLFTFLWKNGMICDFSQNLVRALRKIVEQRYFFADFRERYIK